MNLSDRHLKWYKVPVFLGLVYLELRRLLHQKYNLIAVGPPDEDSGDQYSFFGRNMDQQSQQDEVRQKNILRTYHSALHVLNPFSSRAFHPGNFRNSLQFQASSIKPQVPEK